MDCIDVGHDYFLIKFELQADLESVLRGGPWFVRSQFLAIRQWEPGFIASSATFPSVAVWVRLLELPIEYYEPIMLRKIGQSIGPMLRIVAHKVSSLRGRLARLCIQVNLEKPLIRKVMVGKLAIKVQYKGINSLCFACGRIGHQKEACPTLIMHVDIQVPQEMTSLPS